MFIMLLAHDKYITLIATFIDVDKNYTSLNNFEVEGTVYGKINSQP